MKEAIRKKARTIRDGIAESKRQEKSSAVSRSVHEQNDYKSAQCLLLFSPLGSEVDTSEIFKNARAEGKRVCMPKVVGDQLEIYEVSSQEDLTAGRFGILEPKPHCTKVATSELDLIFVPGLAFDSRGNRIGYGKGFYDKLLKKTAARKIALAFHEQILDDVLAEDHDVPMDLIVTDKNIINPTAQ